MRTMIALIACLALCLGCSREDPPDEPAPTADAATDQPASKEPAPDLPEIDLAGYRRALERHAGKVVLVDFWASWCAPCIEAFPAVVQWQKDYRNDGLVVLSIATNRLSNRQAAVDVLERFEPPFAASILNTPEYDAFVRAVSEQWDGGVPAILLYGRDGTRRHTLGGAHEPDEIEAKIKTLLAERD